MIQSGTTTLPAPGVLLPHAGRPRINWTAITGAIILVGTLLRLAQYLSRQSYWNDEASLLLNIFHHTARQLLGPLVYEQAAPPLFLLAMRGVYVLLGRGELAMRLLPLLLGIGTLVLFARLVRITLAPSLAAVTLALFALSNHLITHAVEAKQYSGDVFVTVALLLLALPNAKHTPAHERLERVALLACVAIWFSHPTAFMFGGIGLTLGATALREGRTHIARILPAILVPAASFAVLYFVSVRHQQSQMLFDYWGDRFMDLSWTLPLWLVRSLLSLFDYAYDKGGVLLFPLGVLGAMHLWRSGRRELLAMLTLPILLTLLAAAMRRYPFGGNRLTLFLAPSCLILAGAGLEMLRSALLPRIGRWWLSIPIVLLAINGAIAAYHLIIPRYRGNMRPVVEYIHAHRQPTEPVFALRQVELLIYWPADDRNLFLGDWPEQFPTRGRFWVALSVGQGRDKLSKELPYDQRGLGEPTAVTRWRGGAVLFYDRERPSDLDSSARELARDAHE